LFPEKAKSPDMAKPRLRGRCEAAPQRMRGVYLVVSVGA
jgi:hypothetical protein